MAAAASCKRPNSVVNIRLGSTCAAHCVSMMINVFLGSLLSLLLSSQGVCQSTIWDSDFGSPDSGDTAPPFDGPGGLEGAASPSEYDQVLPLHELPG